MSGSAPLRIGYVPEHFSTPLHFAKTHFSLSAALVPFPSGTGHLAAALADNEIDVGIGLTEAWIAALGKAQIEQRTPASTDFRLVGTYVETPLCWAISTGRDRDEITSVSDLHGKKGGVSRIGSGSHIMSYVLADQQGWLAAVEASTSGPRPSPFDFIPLQTFARLREGVNERTVDFFMWEHFTSKRYHDNGSIKRIGEIHTPWPSWMMVSQNKHLATTDGQISLIELLTKLDMGIEYFNAHHEEAITYISTELDYSKEDAQEWLETVRFSESTQGVSAEVVHKTVEVLEKGNVLEGECDTSAMIGIRKR